MDATLGVDPLRKREVASPTTNDNAFPSTTQAYKRDKVILLNKPQAANRSAGDPPLALEQLSKHHPLDPSSTPQKHQDSTERHPGAYRENDWKRVLHEIDESELDSDSSASTLRDDKPRQPFYLAFYNLKITNETYLQKQMLEHAIQMRAERLMENKPVWYPKGAYSNEAFVITWKKSIIPHLYEFKYLVKAFNKKCTFIFLEEFIRANPLAQYGVALEFCSKVWEKVCGEIDKIAWEVNLVLQREPSHLQTEKNKKDWTEKLEAIATNKKRMALDAMIKELIGWYGNIGDISLTDARNLNRQAWNDEFDLEYITSAVHKHQNHGAVDGQTAYPVVSKPTSDQRGGTVDAQEPNQRQPPPDKKNDADDQESGSGDKENEATYRENTFLDKKKEKQMRKKKNKKEKTLAQMAAPEFAGEASSSKVEQVSKDQLPVPPEMSSKETKPPMQSEGAQSTPYAHSTGDEGFLSFVDIDQGEKSPTKPGNTSSVRSTDAVGARGSSSSPASTPGSQSGVAPMQSAGLSPEKPSEVAKLSVRPGETGLSPDTRVFEDSSRVRKPWRKVRGKKSKKGKAAEHKIAPEAEGAASSSRLNQKRQVQRPVTPEKLKKGIESPLHTGPSLAKAFNPYFEGSSTDIIGSKRPRGEPHVNEPSIAAKEDHASHEIPQHRETVGSDSKTLTAINDTVPLEERELPNIQEAVEGPLGDIHGRSSNTDRERSDSIRFLRQRTISRDQSDAMDSDEEGALRAWALAKSKDKNEDIGFAVPLEHYEAEWEDMSQDEDETEERYRKSPREPPPYTPRDVAMWRYIQNTPFDDTRRKTGFRLVGRPSGFIDFLKAGQNARLSPGFEGVSAQLSDCRADVDEPEVSFVHERHVFLVRPRTGDPWVDIRGNPNHPDFLPVSKLLEYQAFEWAGFPVWRHDREVHECALRSCSAAQDLDHLRLSKNKGWDSELDEASLVLKGYRLSDYSPWTVICNGCGTKSSIRYCSNDHLYQDIQNHWEECGRLGSIKQVIDERSQPRRFLRRYPAIKERHGYTSYPRHRQRAHHMNNNWIQYGFFDAYGRTFYGLKWPIQRRPWKMEDRAAHNYNQIVNRDIVDRLLNIAFFDVTSFFTTSYLFRLLRDAMIKDAQWTEINKLVLVSQFKAEFSFDAEEHDTVDRDLCVCAWRGRWGYGRRNCTEQCLRSHNNIGTDLELGHGVRSMVELYESRYWILRAWRRYHIDAETNPRIKNWINRVHGEGFPNVPDFQKCPDWRPSMGEGWDGWGNTEDQLCYRGSS